VSYWRGYAIPFLKIGMKVSPIISARKPTSYTTNRNINTEFNKKMNPDTNKCPNCGAEFATLTDGTTFTCGTNRHPDGSHSCSDLCREREENTKLRELLHCAADDLQRDDAVRAQAQRALYKFLKKGVRLTHAPEEPTNPTCHNTTHKFSHCDCNEPVSLDPASKVTHEGNVHAKDKQQTNEIARLREEIDKLWEALSEKEDRRTSTAWFQLK